ncbi:MAG: methyltransferase domain-containing protein [Bryobacteraceae bacterium]|nr:methyltransferase domain-containing protein [Bryobacteraceae bacterium]
MGSIEQERNIPPDVGRLNNPGIEEHHYSSLYNADYYQKGYGPVPYDRSEPQWPLFFGRVADQIIRSLRPKRVFDAGCALGFLVEAFWDRGVEASGMDISSYAIANIRRDMKPYCKVGSIADSLPDRYDLVTCIEILEHMPESDAFAAMRNLTSATDTILFSSTPFDVDQPTHINVRPTIFWLEAFETCGFAPDLLYDASFVAPHAMLLRRQPALPHDVLRTFAELIRMRQLSVDNDNRANILQVELSEVQMRLQATQNQVAQAEQSIRNYEKNVSDLQGQLETKRTESQMLQQIQQRLVVEADELRKSIKSVQEGSDTAVRLEKETSDIRLIIASLDRRILEHDRTLHTLTVRLEAIMHSRTWRILTRAGGLMLRVAGRKA